MTNNTSLKKCVVVIGGSGFIGTNLVKALVNSGNYSNVFNLDLKPPKIEENYSCWRKVDLLNKKLFENLLLELSPNYVIHLAARTDLAGKAIDEYNSNTIGVKNLVESLSKLSTLKRVIFTSSMYVCNPGYIPTDFDDYHPHTIYGESKVVTEKIIKEISPSSYSWCIIRPTSIWGPFFEEPYANFFKLVVSGTYFHLGNRACKKTYGYIENVTYQITALLNANSNSIHKKVFYLGDYEPYDITEWANEIAAIVNRKIPVIPFFLFRMAALVGDFLKVCKINFPMTSFRLRNMTTDNILDLSPIQDIAPQLPVSRKEGTLRTVIWLKREK